MSVARAVAPRPVAGRSRGACAFQDDAVDARLQPGQCVGLGRKPQRCSRRQQRHLDARLRQFVGRQRREARIAEGRRTGILAHVLGQRSPRFEAADAAAQTALLGQCHEGGPGRRQRRVAGCRGGDDLTEAGSNRAARQPQQFAAERVTGHGRSRPWSPDRRRSRHSRRHGCDRRRCRRSCAGRPFPRAARDGGPPAAGH